MISRLRSLAFLTSLYVAFFASGASSLFAEVTWNRMLIVVVGNSMSATALIVVTFMGGLGLGSYAAGEVAARRRSSLAPYAGLELAIGLYVLASPWLFDLLARVFSGLAESVPDRIALSGLRILVTVAALLLPAFLMGATFPAVIHGAALDSPGQRTGRTGLLYSVNTLGAALGCFVAGDHLLFEFGVRTTLMCAFALDLVAALCAAVAMLVRPGRDREPAERPRVAMPEDAPDKSLRTFLYVATFATGFVALAYEVALTRVGILYLGNVVSVFALVLTGFLLGTGTSAVLGTWVYGVLRRTTSHSDRLFGVVALGAGVLVTVTPYVLLTMRGGAADPSGGGDAGDPFRILIVLIGPTIFLGGLLPIAIRMMERQAPGAATREAGTLYALNTAGGLLGAGLVNHLLVPRIGLQGVLVVLTSICVAVGLASLLPARRQRARWSFAVAGGAVAAVVLTAALPRLMDMYAGTIAKATRAGSVHVRLLHEGRAANVVVLDQIDARRGTYRDLYLNGVEEASTRYWHTQLFKLLGTVPLLAHASDAPKQALVIAFGAGITAGSVMTSDRVASLDVVDLNPDVEAINDLFKDVNGDVFHEPRFRFHVDDGRNYLVTNGRRYDVIICDSTHPRAYDSWILYTREFYAAVRSRLRPGGVFAQWVPVDHSMQGALFRIHLNTFRSVFQHATLWYVYGSDQAFLLATPEPFRLDPRRIQPMLDRFPAWFRAREYQIDTVTRLAGFFWLDETAMSRMIGGETRINTDDFHYFDKQSAVWPLPPEWRLPRFQASALPRVVALDEALRAAILSEQWLAQLIARYRFYSDSRDLIAAYCFMPDNGNASYWMARRFAERVPAGVCPPAGR